MDVELYQRQSNLSLSLPKSCLVVGLGGTGSWVALLLAMSGVENLTLMDSDHVELHNLNRIPLDRSTLGIPKVEAVSRLISQLRPDCLITTEGRASDFTLGLVKGEVLFDCTDRQVTQTFLAGWCKKHKVKYVGVHYNGGTHCTVTSTSSAFNTGSGQTGYEVVPSWVGAALFPAVLALVKVLVCPSLEVSLDLADLPKLLGGIAF